MITECITRVDIFGSDLDFDFDLLLSFCRAFAVSTLVRMHACEQF